MGAQLSCLISAVAGAGIALQFVIFELRDVDELTCPGDARSICLILRKTRWYRLLFGVPNPVWALAFFVFGIWATVIEPSAPVTSVGIRIVAVLGMVYALGLQVILSFYLRFFCGVCLILTLLALVTGLCLVI